MTQCAGTDMMPYYTAAPTLTKEFIEQRIQQYGANPVSLTNYISLAIAIIKTHYVSETIDFHEMHNYCTRVFQQCDQQVLANLLDKMQIC